MARIALVSFRLGGTDGVAIEARKWIDAFSSLGHSVTTIAGDGVADILLPGLAISAQDPPTPSEMDEALGDADLVVVENLASLPLNVRARDVLYDVLEGRLALFHHHDLPWQRPHLTQLSGPRDAPTWHHVTINAISTRELHERGIEAVTIMNSFDCAPPFGRRALARASVAVENERLVLMPTRALPRKNVAGALELCEEIDAVLWLLGPAEDGYDQELEALLASSPVDVRRGPREGLDVHDAYAACDLVVMPSTWEGFGNPVLESVTHRRPLAVYPYPVAREIMAYGFHFFDLADVDDITNYLSSPDLELLANNLTIAEAHFNITALPGRLRALLTSMRIG
jgi:glycosyltransferase involved in cell wall biosynthesis